MQKIDSFFSILINAYEFLAKFQRFFGEFFAKIPQNKNILQTKNKK
jgi:hypothetical protein